MYKSKVYSRGELRLAEEFPPGEFIRDELEARDWTQGELARVMGRSLQSINEIINGKRAITPQTAVELASAFETSAELWLNLESTWQLSRLAVPVPAIARRAKQLASA